MGKIYLISGLGIDSKVFQYLDFEANSYEYLPWIRPKHKESIESYAKRMSELIVDDSPIIIGLSFGGMMAIEISKHIYVQKIILISSIKDQTELPMLFKIFGKLNLNRVLPLGFLKINSFATNWMFGTTSKMDRYQLAIWLKQLNPEIMTWSIDKILHWRNEFHPKNLFHIHGVKDRIFPIDRISNCIKIDEAGHLMALNKSKEINSILKSILMN